MKKANLILELMREVGVTLRDLMEASKCFTNGHFSLMLYIDENTQTDDPGFFEEHPYVTPKAVVIKGVIYPFAEAEGECVDSFNAYCSYSRTKKRGVVFPTQEELKPLAEKFREYRAIARCFGLEVYTRCVIEKEENADSWFHYYDFEKGAVSSTDRACPYFTISRLSK